MIIYGVEWRKSSARSRWPFASGEAPPELPDSLLLDMRLVVPGGSQPFRVAEAKGGGGTLELLILDGADLPAATIALVLGADVALARTADGRPVGPVVYDQGILESIIGGFQGRVVDLDPVDGALSPSACQSANPSGLEGVDAAGVPMSGSVVLGAGTGVQYSEDSDGSVRVDLIGSDPIASPRVKTVNGVSVRHLWLASDPGSEIRVVGDAVSTRKDMG